MLAMPVSIDSGCRAVNSISKNEASHVEPYLSDTTQPCS